MMSAVHTTQFSSHCDLSQPCWLWAGYLNCQLHQFIPSYQHSLFGTLSLQNLLTSYEKRKSSLEELLKRYVYFIV